MTFASNHILLEMSSERDKAKRWRPKFSVRTLLFLVAILCTYLACWKITIDFGVESVTDPSAGPPAG